MPAIIHRLQLIPYMCAHPGGRTSVNQCRVVSPRASYRLLEPLEAWFIQSAHFITSFITCELGWVGQTSNLDDWITRLIITKCRQISFLVSLKFLEKSFIYSAVTVKLGVKAFVLLMVMRMDSDLMQFPRSFEFSSSSNLIANPHLFVIGSFPENINAYTQ